MSLGKSVWICLMMALPQVGFAQSGSHGGDAACEGRIKEVMGDLQRWIHAGGASELKFLKGHGADDYGSKMLSYITPVLSKDPSALVLECVSEKVEVDGIEKTCIWFDSDRDLKKHIQCNFMRFNATAAREQEQQVHHEFASIIDYETNRGSNSDYYYSDQLKRLRSWENFRSHAKSGGAGTSPRMKFMKQVNANGTTTVRFISVEHQNRSFSIMSPVLESDAERVYRGICRFLRYDDYLPGQAWNRSAQVDSAAVMVQIDERGVIYDGTALSERLVDQVTCVGEHVTHRPYHSDAESVLWWIETE